MRVLVAGASGFLGRAAVSALSIAGHTVLGLVRAPQRGPGVEAAGGEVVFGDVLDPPSLQRAAKGVDAIVHLATGGPDPAGVRVEGCRNLVAAAKAAGARRFVVGSGYWLHGSRRGAITEATPTPAPGPSVHNLEAERVAMSAHASGEIEAIVVRPGMAYGNASWFAPMVKEIHDGAYRYPGRGTNHWSPVHVEDVGEAYRVIVESGVKGEAYLVVDDAPVPLRTFAEFIAECMGSPAPKGVPAEELARAMDPGLVKVLAANQAASNAKVKRLGWRPRYPTYREGVPAVLREMGLGA